MTFKKALLSSTAIMAATHNGWERGPDVTVTSPKGVEFIDQTVRLAR